MPDISNLHIISITPDKFLANCSASELYEVDLLIQSARFRAKMAQGGWGTMVPPAQIGTGSKADFYLVKQNNILMLEGFDARECPACKTMCYPDAKTLDGTIIYNRHRCQGTHMINQWRRFEIDEEGVLLQ